jgi:hypothetical protein
MSSAFGAVRSPIQSSCGDSLFHARDFFVPEISKRMQFLRPAAIWETVSAPRSPPGNFSRIEP